MFRGASVDLSVTRISVMPAEPAKRSRTGTAARRACGLALIGTARYWHFPCHAPNTCRATYLQRPSNEQGPGLSSTLTVGPLQSDRLRALVNRRATRTLSTEYAARPTEHWQVLHQQREGLLDQVGERPQESGAARAIHRAVVARERQHHRGLNGGLSVDRHHTVSDAAHRED